MLRQLFGDHVVMLSCEYASRLALPNPETTPEGVSQKPQFGYADSPRAVKGKLGGAAPRTNGAQHFPPGFGPSVSGRNPDMYNLRAAKGARVSMLDGEPPSKSEDGTYFSEYGYLYHQMIMLEDMRRTQTYKDAILENDKCFKDKVVLDVGAGTCVLGIFCAKAGAKKVYAVEATDMAYQAKKIVEENGLSDVIEVVRGTMETIELPEKVDVIVSEWMGHFLFRECMLDTVLFARDKYLKPGGALYPSHASLYLAPATHPRFQERWRQYDADRKRWPKFVKVMKQSHGVDYSSMKQQYEKEQQKHYLKTVVWAKCGAKNMLGKGARMLRMDLLRVPMGRLMQMDKELFKINMEITKDCVVEGLCGYFDVEFRGSIQNPAPKPILLSTTPLKSPTHWGQQLFGLYPKVRAKKGDIIHCAIRIGRQERLARLLKLDVKATHIMKEDEKNKRTAKERVWDEVWYVD